MAQTGHKLGDNRAFTNALRRAVEFDSKNPVLLSGLQQIGNGAATRYEATS